MNACLRQRRDSWKQVTALVQELRGVDLYKVPGVSETF